MRPDRETMPAEEWQRTCEELDRISERISAAPEEDAKRGDVGCSEWVGELEAALGHIERAGKAWAEAHNGESDWRWIDLERHLRGYIAAERRSSPTARVSCEDKAGRQ